MENEKANTQEKFSKSVEDAIKETGFVEGGDTTPLLRKTLLNYLTLDSLENLWGPGWSLFVLYTVHATYGECGVKVSYASVKDVISKMTGYDETLPTYLVGESGSVPGAPGTPTAKRTEHALFLGTLICWELKVPGPVEVDYLFGVLGENATPVEAEALWVANPGKYKIDITSEEAMVSMAKAADRLNSERAGMDFVKERDEEYYDMVARVAKKCRAHFATIAQAGRSAPKEETEGVGKASVDTPSSMTPGGSHHSGGSSTGWTTGKIALGAAGVAAVGAALWYGYKRLTGEEHDVNLTDFDIEISDFDSGFDI